MFADDVVLCGGNEMDTRACLVMMIGGESAGREGDENQ